MFVFKKKKTLFVVILHKTKGAFFQIKRDISILNCLKACFNSLDLKKESSDKDTLIFRSCIVSTIFVMSCNIQDLNNITNVISDSISRYFCINSLKTANIIYYITGLIVYTTAAALLYVSYYFFIKLLLYYFYGSKGDNNNNKGNKGNNNNNNSKNDISKKNSSSIKGYFFTKKKPNVECKVVNHKNFNNSFYNISPENCRKYPKDHIIDNIYCEGLLLKMKAGLITLIRTNFNNKFTLNLDFQNLESNRLHKTPITSQNNYNNFLKRFKEYKKHTKLTSRQVDIEYQKMMAQHINDLFVSGYFDDSGIRK